MAAIVQTSDERIYVQATVPYAGAAPNSGGTATVGNNDAVRHIACDLGGSGTRIIRSAAKTGAPGQLGGILGRAGGEEWRVKIPWQLSGTAGTAPDLDPFLQALTGAAPTVGGGSVAYALSSVIAELTLFSFRTAAGSATNVEQRCAWGCVVDRMTLATGDGELTADFSGTSTFVVPGMNLASLSTAKKGGLTAFPSEPASPTYTGNIIPAFVGSVTINGVSSFQIESFSLDCAMARSLTYPFGSFIPTRPQQGRRIMSATFGLLEEAAAAVSTLKALQLSGTAVDISIVWGDTAGYITTVALNNVVIPSQTLDENQSNYVVRFTGAEASMTNSATQDEMTITLT